MPDDHPKSCDIDPFANPSSGGFNADFTAASSTRLLRNAWQVPLVLVSIVAILAALWYRSDGFGGDSAEQLLYRAQNHLQEGEFNAAAGILVELESRIHKADPDLQSQFYLTIGDWHVASAEDLLIATPQQGLAVIDAYNQASALGWIPKEPRKLHLAEALIASGEHARASLKLAPLTSSTTPQIAQRARALKRMLLKQRIQSERGRGTEFAKLLIWVDEFMSLKPGPTEEAWITEVHASVLLEHSNHGGLVERLVLDMRRLEAIDDGTIEWSALHVLLGRVYRATGRPGPAADRFNFAINELSATGRPRGEALRYMGEMHLEVGDLSRAEARFRAALDTAGISTDSYASSELGLAKSLARRGKHAEAMDVFATSLRSSGVVDQVHASRIAKSLRDEGLAAILAAGDKTHIFALELIDAAIRYGDLAAEAATEPEARRDALRLQGVANETYARQVLSPLIGGLDPRDAPLESVPLVMRVDANQHFVTAGEAYLQLDAILEASSKEADGRLVWDAATAFDMGGRPHRAVELYERYVDERSIDDDRRPEALYRLALAHHAALDIAQASRWYRILIDEVDEQDPETTQSSFATRAKVGLARCLSGNGNASKAELLEAEGHLRDIVDGRGAVGPDAPEYREAMFQLGRVLFALERWPDTIEVLDGALKRYRGDPRAPEYAARSGLAWQALAQEAKLQLAASPLSTTRRTEIDEARQEALRSAVEVFGVAISGLDVGGEVQLDPLQMQLLRASYLRRADSIAELGDYEEAMEHYRDIERRFGEDVTAIEALVRMSNLALEYGDLASARTATSRATVKLRRLDRKVLEGPALLDGVATDALEKWIALQPPGGRNGDVE